MHRPDQAVLRPGQRVIAKPARRVGRISDEGVRSALVTDHDVPLIALSLPLVTDSPIDIIAAEERESDAPIPQSLRMGTHPNGPVLTMTGKHHEPTPIPNSVVGIELTIGDVRDRIVPPLEKPHEGQIQTEKVSPQRPV